MLGKFPPGDLSSHLLLHLGVFYPATEIRNARDLTKIEIVLGMGNKVRAQFQMQVYHEIPAQL